MSRIGALWTKRSSRILLALISVVVLYAGAVVSAPHVADTLVVTVQVEKMVLDNVGGYGLSDQKELAFSNVFHDTSTVRGVEDIVSGIPTKPPFWDYFENVNCDNLPGQRLYFYDFQLQRFGITLRDVSVMSWCSEWHISTLGIPDVWTRWDQGSLAHIAALTGIPLIS